MLRGQSARSPFTSVVPAPHEILCWLSFLPLRGLRPQQLRHRIGGQANAKLVQGDSVGSQGFEDGRNQIGRVDGPVGWLLSVGVRGAEHPASDVADLRTAPGLAHGQDHRLLQLPALGEVIEQGAGGPVEDRTVPIGHPLEEPVVQIPAAIAAMLVVLGVAATLPSQKLNGAPMPAPIQ